MVRGTIGVKLAGPTPVFVATKIRGVLGSGESVQFLDPDRRALSRVSRDNTSKGRPRTIHIFPRTCESLHFFSMASFLPSNTRSRTGTNTWTRPCPCPWTIHSHRTSRGVIHLTLAESQVPGSQRGPLGSCSGAVRERTIRLGVRSRFVSSLAPGFPFSIIAI